MSACKEFECFICGKCTAQKLGADSANAPTESQTYSTETVTAPKQASKGAIQMAESNIVFVLGKNEDTKLMQLDEYSGLNGFHIRTIPGKRWNNPVMIGAGAQLLAVVDRFTDYDLIRITDKYGGASINAFDENGFPISNENFWENRNDIHQIALPVGTFVTGLKINARGMLIAHVNDLNGHARYITADATGAYYKPFQSNTTIHEPFHTIGATVGNPAPITNKISQQMHQFVSVISGDTYAAVVVVDGLSSKVLGLMGIPNTLSGLTPTGVAYGNNIVTVLYTAEGMASKVLRFVVDMKRVTQMAHRKSDKNTPGPATYIVNTPGVFKDFRGLDITLEDLPKYLNIAASVNEKADPVALSFDSIDFPVYNPAETSDNLNDNQIQAEDVTVTAPYYNNNRIPVMSITVPETLKLKAIESNCATITQLFNQVGDDAKSDRSKPIFRVLHASHYDWISEGGYTYGYIDDTGATQGITSGIVGQSIATDKDYELGKLKGIDLKAALVDAYTGLLIYRNSKPDGNLRVYGGDYAALDPFVLKSASNAIETEIMAITDDIKRLSGESYSYALAHEGESDPNIDAEMNADSAWLNKLRLRLADLYFADVQRTNGTLATEKVVTDYDGVDRKIISPWLAPTLTPKRIAGPYEEYGDTVPNFTAVPGSVDDYWSMFLRKPALSKQKNVVNLIRRTWSREYTDPDFFGGGTILLPEWTTSNLSPIVADGSFIMRAIGIGGGGYAGVSPEYPVIFNYTGRGGFYVLNVPHSTMTNAERYEEELASLADLIISYQRQVDVENAKQDSVKDHKLIKKLQTYIDENFDRMEQVRAWLGKASKAYYMFPRSVINASFTDIEGSITQEGPTSEEPNAPWVKEIITGNTELSGPPWESIPIGDDVPDKKRACVVEPGPWAWVSITISFRADMMEGRRVEGNRELGENGLGFRADSIDYASPLVASHNLYEAGYMCNYFNGDAWATWDAQVVFKPDRDLLGAGAPDLPDDDVKLSLTGHMATGAQRYVVPVNYADIKLLAPADAQELLVSNLGQDVGNNFAEIYTVTKCFYTTVPLKHIEVSFALKHRAHKVHRWGLVTQVSVENPGGSTPMCFTEDPGYLVGNTCESIFCGNLLCGSLIYGQNYSLQRGDPEYSQVIYNVMEGSVIFTADNPYVTNRGLAYGTVYRCEVYFDLNAPVSGFAIPLNPDVASEVIN